MAETPDQSSVNEQAKRKFQEALERKNHGASRRAHEKGRNAAKVTSSPAVQKRHFQRKAG
ncbi:DUF5302 domain-containing protein [Streptomyces sp. NPDC004244]|uniref:DUF5302 domain-containing protein n=1 Tax=Streptomyces sp. NPDC101206 TaxID=3366128 RepID=UPI003801D749